MFGLFKSKEQKYAEHLLDQAVKSLKNQFENAIAVARMGESDTSIYDERVKDDFIWGYIEGFINAVFFDMGYPSNQFDAVEQKVLKKLFPSFGVDIMDEAKRDYSERFKYGIDIGMEDYDTWIDKKQPKRLGAFIVSGDKAIGLLK